MSDTPISEEIFNKLPQAVKDWIKDDLKWEREDINSVHIVFSSPVIVNIAKGQEKQKQSFVRINGGQWKKV